MLKISRFFETQFTSRQFSRAELLDFTQDHLGRLGQQNDAGQYDEMLSATSAAYEAFGGTVSSEMTAGAIGKARTAAKVALRQTIERRLSGLAGTLHGQFGKESLQFIEFFPRGLNEVRDAREAEIEPILDRVVAAAGTYLPDSVTELTALRTQWLAVYQAATTGRATTAGANDDRDAAKAALQLQLTRNILDLARQHIGQPEKASVFFDESRLYNATSSPDEPLPDEPTPGGPIPTPPIVDEPIPHGELPDENV
ncbi:MAG: hypothetical protein KDA59_05530 [Planctomycetales bacterium]|nr:hypothetical protein [Planctomycetales bacterium]